MKNFIKAIPLSGKIFISIVIVYIIAGVVKQPSFYWGGCYDARESFLLLGFLTTIVFSVFEIIIKKIKKIPSKNSYIVALVSLLIIIFWVVISSLGSACPR